MSNVVDGNKFWVSLTSSRDASRKVFFNTTPVVSESGGVNYSQINPTHMPGTYYVYENTPGRTFELSELILVSRNASEARDNLVRLNQLRGWRMPYFGSSDKIPGGSSISEAQATELSDYLGAPPEVLLLCAYASDTSRGNIYNIPTVLTNLSINYPSDVDYIPTASTGDGDLLAYVPFPIMMTLNMTLNEQHSATEFESFNLASYRSGQLLNF